MILAVSYHSQLLFLDQQTWQFQVDLQSKKLESFLRRAVNVYSQDTWMTFKITIVMSIIVIVLQEGWKVRSKEHTGQIQSIVGRSRGYLKAELDILRHFAWIQKPQSEHKTAFWFFLSLFQHSLQGNFVGPGFKWISPLNTSHWMLNQLRPFVECSTLHDKD